MSLSWIFFSVLALSLCQNCPNNYYLYDGSCNNLAQPTLGVAVGLFRRGPEGAEQGDITVSWPQDPTQQYKLFSNNTRPNERVISNAIISTIVNTPNDRDLNLLSVIFGQLVVHDLSKAARPADNRSNVNITEANDPFLFLLDGTRKSAVPAVPNALIGVRRSGGEQKDGIFEPHNEVSGWLDAHFIYGVSDAENTAVRGPKEDGKIWLPTLTIDYGRVLGHPAGQDVFVEPNFLPLNTQTGLPLDVANIGQNASFVFSAGDSRASENMVLSGIQTVWAREHNRNAANVKAANPTWNDEQIFQKARRLTTAQYQAVVYNEYLPTVWGYFNVLAYVGPYFGYNPYVDGSTGNTFASAAMRVGHSTVKQNVTLYNKCGQVNSSLNNGVMPQAAQPPLGTIQALPSEMLGMVNGFSNLLQAAAFDDAQEGDEQIADTLRNIRINSPAATGVDVSVANIRRGRIHSIPNYHTLRMQYYPLIGRQIYGTPGCPSAALNNASGYPVDPLPCWLRFIESSVTATKMQQLFKKVTSVDAYVGLLVEKKWASDFFEIGANFGPTATSIVLDQFKRSRDGDRFFYKNLPSSLLSLSERITIENTKFSDIIKRNSAAVTLNDNAFLVPTQQPSNC